MSIAKDITLDLDKTERERHELARFICYRSDVIECDMVLFHFRDASQLLIQLDENFCPIESVAIDWDYQ